MADDLEFTLPNETFAEVTAAKNLRVLLHNESRTSTAIIEPSRAVKPAPSTQALPSKSTKGMWRGQYVGRHWRGERW